MRRHTAALLVGLLTVTAAAAHADPKIGGETGPRVPFSGGSTATCATGAVCTSTSDADAAGNAVSSSTFTRESGDHAGLEQAFGYAGQEITYRVPRHAQRITATFTWRVGETSSEAASSSGRIYGWAGVQVHVPECADGSCTVSPPFRTLFHHESASGSPSVVTGTTGPQQVSHTVTIDGALPKRLSLLGSLFTIAGGQPLSACSGGVCTPPVPHAGRASVTVRATLTSVEISAT